jgi:hypothetical protein
MKKCIIRSMLCVIAVLGFFACSSGGGSGNSSNGADTTAPSVPTGLVTSSTSTSHINLSWNASTDAVGVTDYKIYRGGTYIQSAAGLSSSDIGLTASTLYCYQVTAYDAVGNESAKSTQSCATTLASGSTATAPGANFKMPDTNQTTKYSTVFGEDADYTINPSSYTDNGNDTITDNVTGIVWQKQDDGTARTWDAAITYCDNLSLGGQTDWRLPSRIELISLIDNSVYNPAINNTIFPSTFSSNYWSSTTSALNTSNAWYVNFYYGFSNVLFDKATTNYARCVRDGH